MSSNATDLVSSLTNHWNTVLRWPGLSISTTGLKVAHKGETYEVVKLAGGKLTINFIYYNRDNDTYGYKRPKSLIVDEASVPLYLIQEYRGGYRLHHEQQFKMILQIASKGKNEKAQTLDISTTHKRYSAAGKTGILKLPLARFEAIRTDAEDIYKKGNSYRNSVQNYLANRYAKKHINVDTLGTTTLSKGEFDFIVHRLNLPTKKKRDDFIKYLNKADMASLQSLTLELIDKEVFDPVFLRKLDEYFIKEKLTRIVRLGQAIVALKSPDLDTIDGKRVCAAVLTDPKDKKEVKQLETLWQRFFEKYLLYLIFSYREIYPKVGLEVEGNDKFPDFVGVNHYFGVDVIEIKTHLAHALTRDKSHDNFSFSPELSKAIIQTTNYMDLIQQGRFKDDRVVCPRFHGHAVKVVSMQLEAGNGAKAVQPRVQTRGGAAGDGAGRKLRAGGARAGAA